MTNESQITSNGQEAEERMKKKIGIGLLCLLLLLGGAGIWVYNYLFNNLDAETRDKINSQVDNITTGVLDNIQSQKDQLPEDEESSDTPDDESNAEGSGNSSSPSTSGQLSSGASSVITSGTESLTKKTAAIVDIYYGGMKDLEGQGNAIVNQLLSNAKADYKAVKASGGGKTELMSLASSYSNQASALESGMDGSVEGLLSKLKSDLTSGGVSNKDAESIVSQLRSEYKAKKKARYDEVYAQFQAVLK